MKEGAEVVGQIANILVVPPRDKQRTGARAGHGHSARGRHGGGGGGGDDVDVEVFLVATAVDANSQYSFAIGPK